MKTVSLMVTCLTVLVGTQPVLAAPGESSFTPDSLLVPLQAVRLEGPNGAGADLYRCPNSPGPIMSDDAGVEQDDAGTPLSAADECLVDMADNQALAALFAHPVDARPGTYDHITIYLCVDPSRQGYSSYVKGSMHLSGDTYYTSAGSRVLTTRVEQQGYVRLDYAGCASGVPLPAPLTVVENEDITVNAFFSLKNIAWGMLGSNGIGGCTGAPDQTHTVCAAYPIPVTYVGTTSPRLDTLFITEDLADPTAAKAGGQVLLLSAEPGGVFGGFSRRLYSPTSVSPSVNYDTSIRTVVDNAPTAGYTITTWGGGGVNGGPAQEFYIRFPAFTPTTHEGILERPNGQPSVPYRAVLQP
ncbi:MAG: hypothetical protein RL701_2387 [Pseudomonadota bacterium]